MSSTLETDLVQRVLDRLLILGEVEDAACSTQVAAREAQIGTKLYGVERAQLGAKAPQAIAPEVGRILYALIIAARPRLIVEFGASLGYSTIYLASAVQDLGFGAIITTELIQDKAQGAAENLAAAGLDHLVEIRHGDAQTTLRELPDDIDLLLLDGSNDLYLPVLSMLEPRLAPHAPVIADLSHGDPHHARYRDYVTDSESGYLTVEIPVDAGLVVATRQ